METLGNCNNLFSLDLIIYFLQANDNTSAKWDKYVQSDFELILSINLMHGWLLMKH